MKHRLHILIVMVVGIALHLQAAPPVPLALGVTYNRATKHHQNGWGMKLQADLGSRLRLEPELMYFAEHHQVTTLNLSLNLHWRIPLFDHFGIYPLAGLNYSHWGYEGPNASRLGMNVGCGAEYRFMRALSGFTEVRMQLVSHESQPIFTFGLKYHFQ
ncbi:MAG: outer membrane beta-barrel protein [Muribaculaceae bacterium]|nr:outer membrane beta-barrel protein [Muribaculaceae bacterium]